MGNPEGKTSDSNAALMKNVIDMKPADADGATQAFENIEEAVKGANEAVSDGTLVQGLGEIAGYAMQVNMTDSQGLAALWTVLVELGDAAGLFLKGDWATVTSTLKSLSEITAPEGGGKELTITATLTGEPWVLQLLQSLTELSVDLNVNANGNEDDKNKEPNPDEPAPTEKPPEEETPPTGATSTVSPNGVMTTAGAYATYG